MKTKSKSKTVTPRQKVLGALSFHSYRLIVHQEQTCHDKLLRLDHGLGLLAGSIIDLSPSYIEIYLQRIAAWCARWVEALSPECQDVFNLIHAERDRQDKLFRSGDLPYSCSHAATPAKLKLVVLTEEVGEVAEAIQMLDAATHTKAAKAHLISELIQVAAVAVAWLESLEPSSAPSAKSADKKKGANS